MRSRSKSRSTYSILLVASLLTITLATTVTPVAAQESDWRTLETEHFVVEYQSGYEDDARQIGRMTERARTELLAEMPGDVAPTLDEPIHIRVYPGDQWQRSEYTLYWEDTDPVKIHVQSPSDADRVDQNWYEHGLAHEYANIILWDVGQDNGEYNHWQRNPSWYPEGLSEYYVYRTDTVQDQFPGRGVEQMNESIRSGDADFNTVAESNYHGGHLLSMYMIGEYGEGAVWQILRDERSFWSAVESHAGVAKAEFANGWYAWSAERIGGDYSAEQQQSQGETQEPVTESPGSRTGNEDTENIDSSDNNQARNANPQRTQPVQTKGVPLTPTVFFGIVGVTSVLSITVGYLFGRMKGS